MAFFETFSKQVGLPMFNEAIGMYLNFKRKGFPSGFSGHGYGRRETPLGWDRSSEGLFLDAKIRIPSPLCNFPEIRNFENLKRLGRLKTFRDKFATKGALEPS